MSLFFNFKANFHQQKPITHDAVWHPEIPVLAVSTQEGYVYIFNDEGDREEAQLRRPNNTCTCLAWHPRQKLLVMGWDDGLVSWWSDRDRTMKEADVAHQKLRITLAQWSPTGSSLVTADNEGYVVVWRFDLRGRLGSRHNSKQPLSAQVRSICFLDKTRITAQAAPADLRTGADDDAVAEVADGGALESADPLLRPRLLSDDCIFLAGTADGRVVLMDDQDNRQTLLTSQALDGTAITAMLWYGARCQVVIATHGRHIAHYQVTKVFYLNRIRKFQPSKWADDERPLTVLWAGTGLLCCSSSDASLHLIDLDSDANYLLSLADQEDDPIQRSRAKDEKMTCVSFNRQKLVLAGGTREGRIVFWQFVGAPAGSVTDGTAVVPSASDWEAFAEIDLGQEIEGIGWGPGETLLAARMRDSVNILHETVLRRKLSGTYAIVQMSPEVVCVEHLVTHASKSQKASLRIRGLDLYGNIFAVYNEKVVEFYEIRELPDGGIDVVLFRPAFLAEAKAIALHREGILLAKKDRVELHTLAMVRRQALSFSDAEGAPLLLEVSGDHLAVATAKGYVKVWHIGVGGVCKPLHTVSLVEQKARTGKAIAPPATGVAAAAAAAAASVAPGFQEDEIHITSVRLNCDGTKVSVLAKVLSDGVARPDTNLHVFDLALGRHFKFDFAAQQRYVLSHAWDETEPRLIAVETRKVGAGDLPRDLEDPDELSSARIEVTTLFASPKGLVVQDSFHLKRRLTALIGVDVPDLYFYSRFKQDESKESHVQSQRMRDFEGIDLGEGREMARSLLQLSYHLTCSDVEEARRAIRQFDEKAPWKNMAIMCTHAARLDVAEICVRNLQDALAARALREIREEEPDDLAAQNACLAVHLGRVPDAERIYTRAKRYDLLVRLLMACGKWEAALSLAIQKDQIHVPTVHYLYARYLEGCGAIDLAVEQYELADAHRYEVPRMLFALHRIEELERYIISKNNDRALTARWAQWCERNRFYETALTCYAAAEDTLSCVRMHCSLNTPQRAAELVTATGDSAAAFLLAKQYEDQGQMEDALQFYTVARAYRRAIRLAKDLERASVVMSLALRCSRKPVLLDAGAYFESKKKPDKAVLLYQKGGNTVRAIEICVQHKLWTELQQIADDLVPGETDAATFLKCGEVFLAEGHFEHAAKMFTHAKAYDNALRLYAEHEVILTEELADEFNLGPDATPAEKTQLLLNIARVAAHQRSYHLACKKYTQAGDKIKAAKALLKSGDTTHIMFFAAHSRNAEVFVLAANYLQTREWQSNSEIAKNIVAFYTRAKAYDRLSGFYEAVAQHEIVETKSYEKAAKALKEARAALDRMKPPNEALMTELARKCDPVDRFVQARKALRLDPMKAVRMCHELLDSVADDDVHILRVGDVYALLVEFHASKNEPREGLQMLKQMKERRGLAPEDFMEHAVIRKVYAALGMETPDDVEPDDIKHTGELHDDDMDDEVED